MHEKDKSENSYYLYKRLIRYIKPYSLLFIVGVFATIAFSGVDAGAAYYLKPLINKGFIEKDNLFINWVPLVVVLAFVFRAIANVLSSYCMTWVARSVVMELRQQLFSHLLHLPATVYDKNNSGKLVSKLIYDIEQVAQASTDALVMFVQSASLVLGLLIVMVTVSWPLSILFFATAPFILLIVKWSNHRIRKISYLAQHTMGQVTEQVKECIDNYRVVRMFNTYDFESDKFKQATSQSRRCDMKVVIARAYSVSGVQLIAALSIALIVYFAISPRFSTFLTAGEFASIMVAMVALLKPLKNLIRVNSDIQKGLAGAKSVFDLLDLPAEMDTQGQTLVQCKGELIFDNLSFHYPDTDKLVLSNVDFHIQPGQMVAFVGRSGSGKTSLTSLLTRFYQPTQGRILLDGTDIQSLSLELLREQIAFVSQHVTLFSGTIAENIAYGCRDEVSDAAIIEAAKAAHAFEFIEQLPEGLETAVGENGFLLSGGQRQRIALARAVLKDAPILVLDEATSALDSESEHHIQAALFGFMRERTSLVIAHRLSTIERADLIYVLDNGQIIESGNHQQLIAKQGYYAKLYKMQFDNMTQPALEATC